MQNSPQATLWGKRQSLKSNFIKKVSESKVYFILSWGIMALVSSSFAAALSQAKLGGKRKKKKCKSSFPSWPHCLIRRKRRRKKKRLNFVRRKSQSGQEEVAPVDIIKWSTFGTKIRGGDKGVRTQECATFFWVSKNYKTRQGKLQYV